MSGVAYEHITHMVHTHPGVPIEDNSVFPRIEFKSIRLHHRLTEIELVIMGIDKRCVFRIYGDS